MVGALIHLILIHSAAYADLSAGDTQAVRQTKDLLTNQSERNQFINKDPKAKELDDKVGSFAGTPENKEQIYELSSQLMDKLVAEAGGNTDKLQTLMLEAQKDPKAFYEKYLDASQKAKVHEIANKVGPASVGAPK